jgi:glutamine synthetase
LSPSSTRKAFGDAAVDHYTNTAGVELAAVEAAVNDWELIRSSQWM